MKSLFGIFLLCVISSFSSSLFGQVQISIPDLSVESTETTVIVPILVEGLQPDSIEGYTFIIGFDSAVISIDNYSKSSTLSSEFSIQANNSADNSYAFSGAGTKAIATDGVIINLEVSLIGVGNSAIEFLKVELNEGNPSFTTKNGSIDVVASSAPPVVVNPLGAITLDEDFENQVVRNLNNVFSDDETLALMFEIIDTLSILEARIEEGELILNSLQNENGTGQIVIKATDEDGASTVDTLQVTISPVNDVPYFIEIPDTLRFVSGEELTFQYGDFVQDVEDELTDLAYSFSISPEEIIFEVSSTETSITITASDYIGEGILTFSVMDTDGAQVSEEITIIIDISTSLGNASELPGTFSMSQNYPNPFNPSTQINYTLQKASLVKIDVITMLGQRAATLVNERKTAGNYTVTFDASGLSSGVYFYTIKAGEFINTKKMLLIK